MYVSIGGRWLYLWRAIDRNGEVYAAVTNCATEATGYSGRAGLKVYRIF